MRWPGGTGLLFRILARIVTKDRQQTIMQIQSPRRRRSASDTTARGPGQGVNSESLAFGQRRGAPVRDMTPASRARRTASNRLRTPSFAKAVRNR